MGLGRFSLLLEQPRDLPFDLDEPVASLIKREMEWRLHEMDEKPQWESRNVGKEHCKGCFTEEKGPQASHEGLADFRQQCWGKCLLTAFTSYQATIPLGPLFLTL